MSLRSKPRKRLIGYARVSTQQQDLARQIKALKRLGCSVIYSDSASGKSMAGRPELARALEDLDLYRPCHPHGARFHGDDVSYGGRRAPADHQAHPRRTADHARERRPHGPQAETDAAPDQGGAAAHRQGEPTRSLVKSYGVSISTISRLAA